MLLSERRITISVIIILLVVIFGYMFFERYLTETTVTITVLNKAPVPDEQSEYLIFTKDELFEDVNNSYQNKYNSDEIYKKLQIGQTYTVKVVSIYIPSIPHYRNIVEIEHNNQP